MIYVLEDDESIRELIIYTLNGQSMEARGFAAPSEFWAAMSEKTPSLVLLDIMLPEEDGFSILQKLRAAPATKRLPIIMLTAKGSEYDIVRGLDIGADDYIPKPFRMMELAQESLAGRAAVLHMPSLSQHEIYGSGENKPFSLGLDALKARGNSGTPAALDGIYQRIWKGSLPGYISGKFTDRDVFYSSYLQTYIDRDVSEQVLLTDKFLFQDFIRAAACRAGQMLNIHDIAQDVGVSDDTAKRWLQVLEKSDIIFYLRPYSNNLLKRTIKTPKLYFFDTGLVAYLTRYSSPEILQNGAMNGAILENYVVAEIRKSYQNAGQDCLLWYYRDKNSNEIDLVIESDGQLHPLEIKRSVNPGSELTGVFSVLDKGSVPRGTGAVICMRSKLSAVSAENFIVPVWML